MIMKTIFFEITHTINVTMIKKFIVFCIMSAILWLALFWVNAFKSVVTVSWANTVVFFVFTILCLNKGARDRTQKEVTIFTTAICLGRIILEIPLRIIDYQGMLFSLLVPVCTIVAIALAAVCYYERRTSVYVLSTIILLLLNTVVQFAYLEYCDKIFNK